MGLPSTLIRFELFLRRIAGQSGEEDFSRLYWKARYRWGGTSGKGSRGAIAAAKSAYVTQFCRDHGVDSLVELGSGDGICASRIEVPAYLGLDLSADAIALAARRCDPATHRFLNIAGEAPETIAEKVMDACGGVLPGASLSMDVILHLVEDRVFEDYLRTLYAVSGRYIIVFSSDFDSADAAHVRHRAYAKRLMSDFPLRLIASEGEGLKAHFKVFEKV